MSQSRLKPLHSDGSLSQPKLTNFRKLSTETLTGSLRPGEPGALKVKADGTIMDGHHRVYVLRERGVDVDSLPRESLE
jgi:archaellum component FlaG (FlaF/FlaG flagellin family)